HWHTVDASRLQSLAEGPRERRAVERGRDRPMGAVLISRTWNLRGVGHRLCRHGAQARGYIFCAPTSDGGGKVVTNLLRLLKCRQLRLAVLNLEVFGAVRSLRLRNTEEGVVLAAGADPLVKQARGRRRDLMANARAV